MTAEFQQLASFAETMYAERFSRIGDGEFAIGGETLTIYFAELPGNPAMVLVRASVLELKDVRRQNDFAKAVLAGNVFWGGTRGATLSVGEDGALHLTERRFTVELNDAEGLESCVDEFIETAGDWRERSELYA